jgi:hypothetical protein
MSDTISDPLNIESEDYDMFDEVRGSRTLTSNVRVEKLLMDDKDLLALFFVVITWSDAHWYEFENINDIPPQTEAYWRQLDMNRVAHTCWGLDGLMAANVGSHCGDCIKVACTCERCLYEYYYLVTKRLRGLHRGDPLELSAMLLARDHIRFEHKAMVSREIDAERERKKDADETTLMWCIMHVYDKFPSEYSIDLQKHIDHWAILSDGERQPYLSRAKQIREWCDQRPECPGVPW